MDPFSPLVSVKVENKSEEFVLYMVHESGGESQLLHELRSYAPRLTSFALSHRDLPERTRLRDDEYPLVTRVLHGPCEKISKILITEADLGEEVTYDVSASPSVNTLCGQSAAAPPID